MMDESTSHNQLRLPGFRFHPTEEELLNFYLKSMVFDKKLRGDIIGFLNIYNYDPWELPGLAKIGEREWYFFVPRDKKHGSGGRPNRTTQNGFWKATGSDRKILSISSDPKKMFLGLKKTLVFYEGRAPRGRRTDWIMNEYRLPDNKCSPPSKDIVLCKIYRKATSMKALEQRAAIVVEETIKTADQQASYCTSSQLTSSPDMDPISSFLDQFEDVNATMTEIDNMGYFERENENMMKTISTDLEDQEEKYVDDQDHDSTSGKGSTRSCCKSSSSSLLTLPINGKQNLADLQVPKINNDWTQDSFWTQLNSPWLENLPHFLQMY